MSEYTKCNYCQLQSMKKEAKKRGVTVKVKHQHAGEWKGWTTAMYSDEEEPSAYFMSLPKSCAC